MRRKSWIGVCTLGVALLVVLAYRSGTGRAQELVTPLASSQPGPNRNETSPPQARPLGLPVPGDLLNQPGVLRASGGPYLSQTSVKAAATRSLGCEDAPGPQANVAEGRCDSVSATAPMSYGVAAAQYPDWGTPGGLAPDREVFLVTVRGHFRFQPKSMHSSVANGVWVTHFNSFIDATTGTVLGAGTQGTPLT